MYIDDIYIVIGCIAAIFIYLCLHKEPYVPAYNVHDMPSTPIYQAFMPPTYSSIQQGLNDPLYPPYTKYDQIQLPQISTRPCYDFKKIGYLNALNEHNDQKYKFLILIGRRSCISNSVFDYYAIENNDKTYLKFDMSHITKELLTGDEIFIPALNKKYIVHIDRLDPGIYCPY